MGNETTCGMIDEVMLWGISESLQNHMSQLTKYYTAVSTSNNNDLT